MKNTIQQLLSLLGEKQFLNASTMLGTEFASALQVVCNKHGLKQRFIICDDVASTTTASDLSSIPEDVVLVFTSAFFASTANTEVAQLIFKQKSGFDRLVTTLFSDRVSFYSSANIFSRKLNNNTYWLAHTFTASFLRNLVVESCQYDFSYTGSVEGVIPKDIDKNLFDCYGAIFSSHGGGRCIYYPYQLRRSSPSSAEAKEHERNLFNRFILDETLQKQLNNNKPNEKSKDFNKSLLDVVPEVFFDNEVKFQATIIEKTFEELLSRCNIIEDIVSMDVKWYLSEVEEYEAKYIVSVWDSVRWSTVKAEYLNMFNFLNEEIKALESTLCDLQSNYLAKLTELRNLKHLLPNEKEQEKKVNDFIKSIIIAEKDGIIRLENEKLVFLFKDIEILDVKLGDYEIAYNGNLIKRSAARSDAFIGKYVGGGEVKSRSNPHPHIWSDGKFCFGEFINDLGDAFADKNLDFNKIHSILKCFLQSYNAVSPVRNITFFTDKDINLTKYALVINNVSVVNFDNNNHSSLEEEEEEEDEENEEEWT